MRNVYHSHANWVIPGYSSNALCARGEVSLQAHRRYDQEAEHWFQEALAVFAQDREPNRKFVTMSRFGLAQVVAKRGKQEEARQIAEQCLQVFVEMNHRTAEKVRIWLDRLSPTTESSEGPKTPKLKNHRQDRSGEAEHEKI